MEDLREDLAMLRESKGMAEKSLTVHENRRKRYSRLQESATAMASSLELEKLADLALGQAAQLLNGLPLSLSIFLLDPAGDSSDLFLRGSQFLRQRGSPRP